MPVVAADDFALDAMPDVTDGGNFFNDTVMLADGTDIVDSLGVGPRKGTTART